jgi:rhodanese-related sulfurtransferase
MRSALREAALLLLAALFLAVCHRQFFAADFAWIRTAPAISYAADTSHTEDFSLAEINVADSSAAPLLVTMERAAQIHRERAAVFIDAREDERFVAGHIAEAVHVSYYNPESWQAKLQTLSHESRLVVYCDDDCDSARRLAEALLAQGFKKIFVMDKGFDSWKNAGYPTAP